MRIGYFDYNGKRYQSGTIFSFKFYGSVIEGVFLYYDNVSDNYVYVTKIKPTPNNPHPKGWHYYFTKSKHFFNSVIEVTDKTDQDISPPATKQKPEDTIDGLSTSWIWYITLMAIGSVFYERVIWWITLTLIFFGYRSGKIKEEGTVYERQI